MEENTKATESAAGETAESASAQTAESSDAQVEALTAERDRIARERAELQDQFLRLRAEFDNFRKRAQKERTDFADFAAMEAVNAMLPVLDDFERALKVETADREYAKGIEMIYQRLFESLKKLGLEPIVCEGQKFDPALHHAVETAKTAEAEDQTILQVHQSGYNFKGKLLRPAMVKVAVEP